MILALVIIGTALLACPLLVFVGAVVDAPRVFGAGLVVGGLLAAIPELVVRFVRLLAVDFREDVLPRVSGAIVAGGIMLLIFGDRP